MDSPSSTRIPALADESEQFVYLKFACCCVPQRRIGNIDRRVLEGIRVHPLLEIRWIRWQRGLFVVSRPLPISGESFSHHLVVLAHSDAVWHIDFEKAGTDCRCVQVLCVVERFDREMDIKCAAQSIHVVCVGACECQSKAVRS